jgi:hypothetical protein
VHYPEYCYAECLYAECCGTLKAAHYERGYKTLYIPA